MMLYNTQITKALIRLRGCAGWSVPLLFAYIRRQGFLPRGPFVHNKYPVAYASFCYKAVFYIVVVPTILWEFCVKSLLCDEACNRLNLAEEDRNSCSIKYCFCYCVSSNGWHYGTRNF